MVFCVLDSIIGHVLFQSGALCRPEASNVLIQRRMVEKHSLHRHVALELCCKDASAVQRPQDSGFVAHVVCEVVFFELEARRRDVSQPCSLVVGVHHELRPLVRALFTLHDGSKNTQVVPSPRFGLEAGVGGDALQRAVLVVRHIFKAAEQRADTAVTRRVRLPRRERHPVLASVFLNGATRRLIRKGVSR